MATKFSAIVAAGAITGTDKILGVQAGPTDVVYTFTTASAAISSILGLTALATTAPGTGVVTALTNTAGGAGGFALVGTTPPTGTAGGDLSGSYPNPNVKSASNNGAASSASFLLPGTLFTGGTGTTTFPQFFIQPTGTTAVTTWSTAGTILGMNIVAGFAGSFLDFHVGGAASVFGIASDGSVATASNVVLKTNGSSYRLRNGGAIIGSPADASIQLGANDAATAVAQTLRVQSVVAGTAAANGANWTLIGSLPTGTGTSGDIIFQTGVKTGSGTTQGTPTTALTLKGETQTVQVASGKQLQLGNAATTGLAAGVLAATTNATIVLTDSTGQAYRIPCII